MTKKKRSVSGKKGAGYLSPKPKAPALLLMPTFPARLMAHRGRLYFERWDAKRKKSRLHLLGREGESLTAERVKGDCYPDEVVPMFAVPNGAPSSERHEEIRFFANGRERGLEEFFPATWSWAPSDVPIALAPWTLPLSVSESDGEIRILARRECCEENVPRRLDGIFGGRPA